jgi:probable F420-dependent oxidoreductase
MRIDNMIPGELRAVADRARALEDAGFDGLMSTETGHDPFLPLAIAAEHTGRVDLMTQIAVAFARNPMLIATCGHDLNAYSRGRAVIGLGSQIESHITRRYSMPWSKPAARMREFIQAMHAIWDAWYEGRRLDFRGEFYTHTLMTPFFAPTDTKYGRPRVYLAAVGPVMTEVAAEVADGIICHPFTTARYIREVTLPAIERGLAKAGRMRESFAVAMPAMVVAGTTAPEFAKSRATIREQIAFYGSTPAYRGVFELHGRDGVQEGLHRLSREGKWREMAALVDDEMLDAVAVSGETPEQVAAAIRTRYAGLVDRLAPSYLIVGPEFELPLARAIKSAVGET